VRSLDCAELRDHFVAEKITDRRVALGAMLDEISTIFESSSLQRLQPTILELREKLAADKVRLAVLGQMKRGKSSLLNSLLGENVLPTGVLPLTSVVTEIRYAKVPKVSVCYQSGSLEEVPLSEIAEYVTETRNPGNCKRVLALHLLYPCELLRDGLILVDTPGFGSTYTHNTAVTLEYLAKVDAAVVVFSVDPPITEVEANFIRDIQKDIPQLMFVLNKADLLSDEEIEAARRFLRDELANRLGLADCNVFPLTTRTSPAAGSNKASSAGLSRFIGHLRHFARYGHDETLFLSILRAVAQALNLALFALSLSRRFSSLSAPEVKEKREALQLLLDDAARDTAGIAALLREERLDLMKRIDADLERHVRTATPYLEKRLLSLQRENSHCSGRALGHLLEGFFNDEITTIFRDWRQQEDAQLSTMLTEIVLRHSAKASAILNTLASGIGSLVDLPATKLKANCGLAMDSRVSYSIERIFFSLDSFLLAVPPFLQRPLVFRRAMKSIPQRLDGNSGRIRFDYLERMERSFQLLERSLTSQIEDARQTLVGTLEVPCADAALWKRIEALRSCVHALT
jgi:GTP-binding protein EngB required for normal cell division